MSKKILFPLGQLVTAPIAAFLIYLSFFPSNGYSMFTLPFLAIINIAVIIYIVNDQEQSSSRTITLSILFGTFYAVIGWIWSILGIWYSAIMPLHISIILIALPLLVLAAIIWQVIIRNKLIY